MPVMAPLSSCVATTSPATRENVTFYHSMPQLMSLARRWVSDKTRTIPSCASRSREEHSTFENMRAVPPFDARNWPAASRPAQQGDGCSFVKWTDARNISDSR